jgi:hypothetical protein
MHEHVANRNQCKYTGSQECAKISKIKLYKEEEDAA